MTVPETAFPLCKVAFAEAKRGHHTYDELDYLSGVLRGTMKQWRRGVVPRIFTIESILLTMGWRLEALPHSTEIPEELRRDLEAALDRHGASIPALAYLPEVSLPAV